MTKVEFIILILLIILFAGVGVLVLFGVPNNLACERKYGKGWEYRHQIYEADICVNENGEFKYL